MEVGDFVSITCFQVMLNTPIVNVFDYRVTSVSAPNTIQFSEGKGIADGWLNEVYLNQDNEGIASVTHLFCGVYKMAWVNRTAPGESWEGNYSIGQFDGTIGTGATDIMPNQIAYYFKARREQITQTSGKKFLGGVPREVVTGNDVTNTTALSKLGNTLSNTWTATFGFPDPLQIEFQPVVLNGRKPLGELPVADNWFDAVWEFQYLTSLNRRRQGKYP